MAFGQGVSVTPLQLTMALAAMGNGGVLMEPRLVKEVDDPYGRKVQEFPPRPLRRVLSERAAQQILAIMATVTQPGGTAKEAAPEGFTVAGKTGTAQKLEGRAYSHSKFNALFIGMIPAEKPVFAIGVIVDEPKGAIYGGVVAAPDFREIAAQSMRVLEYVASRNWSGTRTCRSRLKRAARIGAEDGRGGPLQGPGSHIGGVVADGLEMPKGPLTVMPDLKGYTIGQGTGPADPLRIEMPPGGQRHGCEPGALPGDQPLPAASVW